MRWILVGDSQAVGLERFLRSFLAERGYAFAGSVVEVGWSTGRMVASRRVERLTAERRPDLVLVVLGGNDTSAPNLAVKVRELLTQIGASPFVVWIGPAHVGASHPEVAARKRQVTSQQRQLARTLGFEWHDGIAMTADLEHAPDDLHFTRDALRAWAARIDRALFERPGGIGWWVAGGLGFLGAVSVIIYWSTR